MFRENAWHTGNIATNAWYPTVSFRIADTSTQGNWKERGYGSKGYYVIGDTYSYPTYVPSLTALDNSGAIWASSTSDIRALERGGTGRIAACWYAPVSFDVVLPQTDGLPHLVSLYFLDWDSTVRQQTVDIRNCLSGASLSSVTVSGFNSGKYYAWLVTGSVTIHITRTGGANAVLSGIFFN